MTEEEAKTKWCPFVRRVVYDKYAHEFQAGVTVGMTAANRNTDQAVAPLGGVNCIASACMAWRTLTKPVGTGMVRERIGGYCGLAGMP